MCIFIKLLLTYIIMKKIVCITILFIAIIIGCKTNIANSNKLNIVFEPKSGSTVSGTATFTEQNGKVTFSATLAGLKPGIHAIHIHEIGLFCCRWKLSRWSLESNFQKSRKMGWW
jgi:Cu/Zn superoxide dismutase